MRPLLEGKTTVWRDMVASEVAHSGRMIRTDQYKYITYKGDPVEQLFDMKNDPWETKNLADESKFASALDDHRKLLTDWGKPAGPGRAPELKRPWTKPKKARGLRMKRGVNSG